MHIRYSTNYANVNVLNEHKRLKHKIVHFLIIGSKTKNLREKSTNFLDKPCKLLDCMYKLDHTYPMRLEI